MLLRAPLPVQRWFGLGESRGDWVDNGGVVARVEGAIRGWMCPGCGGNHASALSCVPRATSEGRCVRAVVGVCEQALGAFEWNTARSYTQCSTRDGRSQCEAWGPRMPAKGGHVCSDSGVMFHLGHVCPHTGPTEPLMEQLCPWQGGLATGRQAGSCNRLDPRAASCACVHSCLSLCIPEQETAFALRVHLSSVKGPCESSRIDVLWCACRLRAYIRFHVCAKSAWTACSRRAQCSNASAARTWQGERSAQPVFAVWRVVFRSAWPFKRHETQHHDYMF